MLASIIKQISMSKERLTHLLQKYADKTCSQAEYAELMTIINDEDNYEEIDLVMNDEWEHHISSPKMEQGRVDQLFDKILAAGKFSEEVKKPVKLNQNRSWTVWAAAALLLGTFVFLYDNQTAAPDKVIEVKTAAHNIRPSVNIAAVAEHRKINLPDGSIVVLNNGSTLEFPEQFLGMSREVILKGEGYFDIRHDAEKPFIVHTGKISTTVLGTAFNVKAYDKENDVVVTVTRGKVIVKNEQKTLGIIVPNQQIVFNKVQMKSSIMPVLAKQTVEWQEKDLFFDDVTMEEAMLQLAKRFNITISFANEASKSCRFTATFLKGESLDEILQIITSFNHIAYQKNAGEVMISGNGCK